MSSGTTDEPSPPDTERDQLKEFAATLAMYRDELIAQGFKRGEAIQVCRDYQELRFMPVAVQVPVEETGPAIGKGGGQVPD